MPSLLLARPLSCLASCADATRPRPPPTARPCVSMLPGLAHRRPPEPPPPCPARVLPPPGLPIHGRLFVLLPRLASFAMTDRPGRHHRTRPCPPIEGEEGWRPLLVKKVSILVKAAYLSALVAGLHGCTGDPDCIRYVAFSQCRLGFLVNLFSN
jgi:hypothetical protein